MEGIMFKSEVVLTNKSGFHARPASVFLKEALEYKSDIKVGKNKIEYNGKSIIGILSMGAVKGDLITIIAEGEDEKEAVESLKRLVQNGFGE